MAERGTIRNIRFARQRADFNGMRFGTITPTDIDGFVEFSDEVFIFMETKHGDAELPRTTYRGVVMSGACGCRGACG